MSLDDLDFQSLRPEFLSRSWRGYIRLNSRRFFVSDNDVAPFSKSYENYYFTVLKEVSEKQGLTFRVYRTKKGLRTIITSRTFSSGLEGIPILQAIGSDPDFIALGVRMDGLFSGRITPKPANCDKKWAGFNIFRAPIKVRAEFYRVYDYYIKSYAVCEYLDTIGYEEPVQDIKKFLEFHDTVTKSYTKNKLA